VRSIFSIEKPSQTVLYKQFGKKLHNKFLLWAGCRQTSIVSTLRNGLKMPSLESASTGLMFGKGIYLTDCFSKAANQCQVQPSKTKLGVVFLVEAALGEMHLAYQPEQFKTGAVIFSHSVYGVGKQKPDIKGLVDLNSTLPDFAISADAAGKAGLDGPRFFNTGRMRSNPEYNECPPGVTAPDLRFNDFVVFDPAQVVIRYAVLCEFHCN
jgi:hypothetical protein